VSLCRRPWSLMYFTANGRALRAVSRRFRNMATTLYAWPMQGSSPCRRSGTGPRIGLSCGRCFRTKPPESSPIAACAGACERGARRLGDHSVPRRGTAIGKVVTTVLALECERNHRCRQRLAGSYGRGRGRRGSRDCRATDALCRAIQAGIAAVRDDAGHSGLP